MMPVLKTHSFLWKCFGLVGLTCVCVVVHLYMALDDHPTRAPHKIVPLVPRPQHITASTTLSLLQHKCALRFENMSTWEHDSRSNDFHRRIMSMRGLVCFDGKRILSNDTFSWKSGQNQGPIASEPLPDTFERSVELDDHVAIVFPLATIYQTYAEFMVPAYVAMMNLFGGNASKLHRFPRRSVVYENFRYHRTMELEGKWVQGLASKDTSVHFATSIAALAHDSVQCFCRAMFLVGGEFYSVPETQSVSRGDPLRRDALQFIKEGIAAHERFLPYGQYPVPPSVFRTQRHYWTPPLSNALAPRLLLFSRPASRAIGEVEQIVRVARDIGFNTAVINPAMEPVQSQVHLARYSDMMMGTHASQMTWQLLMDTEDNRKYCRRVVELQHYGKPFQGRMNIFEALAADAFLKYIPRQPVFVTFTNDKKVKSPEKEKALLMRRVVGTAGFRFQKTFYNLTELAAMLRRSFEELTHCLIHEQWNFSAPMSYSP